MKDRLLNNMLKYDGQKKEPSIYDILIFTAIASVVFVLFFFLKVDLIIYMVSFIVYFLAVFAMICSAYLRQLQCNPYSYNMIYYRGFALFFLIVLINHIIFGIEIIRQPESFTLHDIILSLMDSAISYVLLSFPVVVVFSIALCVSNINLIRHEGKRLVNILGIILSFLMIAGILFLFAFGVEHPLFRGTQARIWLLIINILATCYLYFECMLFGSMLAVLLVARYEPDTDKDFIIILGCGIRKDGTPTPLLRGRIERALAFYKKQKEETGKEAIFVTSGGQGPNEVISESECMKKYLLEQGIPGSQIIEENKSTDTFENMKFSKAKIMAVNPNARVAFSTTNYHVFRSGLYIRRLGMNAVGMGQPTKWWFWPNAAVREFVGLLTEHKGRQALIFGSFIVTYAGLTLLAFLR